MVTVLSLPHSTLLKTTLWIRCPARFIIIVLLVYLNVKAIAMWPFQSCACSKPNCIKTIHRDQRLNCLHVVFCSGNLFTLEFSMLHFSPLWFFLIPEVKVWMYTKRKEINSVIFHQVLCCCRVLSVYLLVFAGHTSGVSIVYLGKTYNIFQIKSMLFCILWKVGNLIQFLDVV